MASVTRYPTGNATASGTWTNGNTGLNADDGTKANFTTTTKNDVRTLTCGTFGFDSVIPVGATIDEVYLEVQNDGTTGGTQRHVIIVGGTDGANNDNSNGTETERVFGPLTRPGGGSWTRDDLLDGTLTARVEGRQPNNTTSRNYAWDYLRVRVEYTLPDVTFASTAALKLRTDYDPAAGGGPISRAALLADTPRLVAVRALSPALLYQFRGEPVEFTGPRAAVPDASGNGRWGVQSEEEGDWVYSRSDPRGGNDAALLPGGQAALRVTLKDTDALDNATPGYRPFSATAPCTWSIFLKRSSGAAPNAATRTQETFFDTYDGGSVALRMRWDGSGNRLDDIQFQWNTTPRNWTNVGIGTDAWHHVAVRLNPSASAVGELAADTIELFVDGVSLGTIAETQSPVFPNDISVGTNGAGWFGDIYEPAFFPAILSAAQIRELAGVVELASAPALTLGATGALTVEGAGAEVTLASQAGLALTAAGALSADVTLASATALTLGAAGAASVDRNLTSQADLVLSTAGALSAERSLAAQANLQLASTADLTLQGQVTLASTTALNLSAAGALSAERPFIAETALALGAAGDLTIEGLPPVELTSTANLALMAAGALSVDRTLSAAGVLALTAAGALSLVGEPDPGDTGVLSGTTNQLGVFSGASTTE